MEINNKVNFVVSYLSNDYLFVRNYSNEQIYEIRYRLCCYNFTGIFMVVTNHAPNYYCKSTSLSTIIKIYQTKCHQCYIT